MDMITLAMAKAYSDSKGGYVKPETVLFQGVVGKSSSSGTETRYQYNTPFKPEAGQSYVIVLNGVRYDAVFDKNGITIQAQITENITIFTRTNPGNVYLQILAYEDLGETAHLEIATPETIVPIKPEYIPAMDSLTLNGADGKQYKVAVDANGALTATPIE